MTDGWIENSGKEIYAKGESLFFPETSRIEWLVTLTVLGGLRVSLRRGIGG